ncbi:MAG: RluA family pseudouridine synthase [Rhodospirillales bacterium]
MSGSTYTVVVDADKAGTRLDQFLAGAVPAVSRTRLKGRIQAGDVVTADGTVIVDPAHRTSAGDLYRLTLPAAPSPTPAAQVIPLMIVHEDDALIVIDKQANLVVHPGAGAPDGTLVNALLAHCPSGLSSIGAPRRPGIVHRLDKDTTGLIVVAKTDQAYLDLARQFAEHSVERAYFAVVYGHPVPVAGRIVKAIGRSERDRTRMAVVQSGGKSAITHYRLLRPIGTRASLVECRLATGRTHQIRVHLASIGHGIVGDPVYRHSGRGGRIATSPLSEILRRQALHAYLIGFRHPLSGAWLHFESGFPSDIKELMNFLETI